MQPSLDSKTSEPLIEIFESLAPPHLHAAAWAACAGKRWYFGHGSNDGGHARFWKMDLEEDAAFNAIWELARARCEAMAGTPLRVVRQYANGHTYGLGGEPHRDDTRAGTFTLLYYPNPEWKSGWDGETVFYEQSGEIAFSVLLRPNRAVFFDSRILHAGRAPSRICTALRVSVAYKLEAAIAPPRPRMEDAGQIHAVRAAGPSEGLETLQVDGAKRLYRARIAETEVLRAVEDRLTELAVRLRLPGFRPGRIPNSVLHQRYGAQARAAVLKRLAVGVALRELPAGSVASACDLLAGAESGEMVIALAATHLPDLPELDYSALKISRIVVVDGDPSPEEAAFARDHWKSQVLDRLDAAYPIPLFPGLIDRELAAILKVAESSGSIPGGAEERQALEAEFRKIAERRLRLGVVVTELARRLGMQAADGAGLEDRVLERLAEQAAVTELRMAAKDLREMMAS